MTNNKTISVTSEQLALIQAVYNTINSGEVVDLNGVDWHYFTSHFNEGCIINILKMAPQSLSALIEYAIKFQRGDYDNDLQLKDAIATKLREYYEHQQDRRITECQAVANTPRYDIVNDKYIRDVYDWCISIGMFTDAIDLEALREAYFHADFVDINKGCTSGWINILCVMIQDYHSRLSKDCASTWYGEACKSIGKTIDNITTNNEKIGGKKMEFIKKSPLSYMKTKLTL